MDRRGGRGDADVELRVAPARRLDDGAAVRRVRRDAMAVPLHADPRRRPGSKDGEVGINRLLARLRHLFNWAIKKRYGEHTPLRRNGVVVGALETRVENGRSRRLDPGEEDRLLQNANPRMQAFIVAMLATGCRPGELLSLQWSQIRRDDTGRCLWMDLPVERTKTYQQRTVQWAMLIFDPGIKIGGRG